MQQKFRRRPELPLGHGQHRDPDGREVRDSNYVCRGRDGVLRATTLLRRSILAYCKDLGPRRKPGSFSWSRTCPFIEPNVVMHCRGRPWHLLSVGRRRYPLLKLRQHLSDGYRTIVQMISATTTDTGLKVRAELDKNKYPKDVKVTDARLAAVNLTPHKFHGDWNYTISPKKKSARQR